MVVSGGFDKDIRSVVFQTPEGGIPIVVRRRVEMGNELLMVW